MTTRGYVRLPSAPPAPDEAPPPYPGPQISDWRDAYTMLPDDTLPAYTDVNYQTAQPIASSSNYQTGQPMASSVNYQTGQPIHVASNYQTTQPMSTNVNYQTGQPMAAGIHCHTSSQQVSSRNPTVHKYGPQHVVYVYKDRSGEESYRQHVMEESFMLGCCWALLCCCLLNND